MRIVINSWIERVGVLDSGWGEIIRGIGCIYNPLFLAFPDLLHLSCDDVVGFL